MMDGSAQKLRVVIVDDSLLCRTVFRDVLESGGDIEVVGEAADGFTAISVIEKVHPDVVTMDVEMPGKNGLETVEQIMSRTPVPILVVTGAPLNDEAGVAFRAIECGAADIIAKPLVTDDGAADRLRAIVRTLASTPVFQTRQNRARATIPSSPGRLLELVVVTAGAGAMPLVFALAGRMSRVNCPIVLHTSATGDLADGLGRYFAGSVAQRVTVARPPQTSFGPGELVVVPGVRATCMSRGTLFVEGRLASAGPLLTSVAEVYGDAAAAVALSAIGDDARAGLSAMVSVGAATFVESSVRESEGAEFCGVVDEIADYLVVRAGWRDSA